MARTAIGGLLLALLCAAEPPPQPVNWSIDQAGREAGYRIGTALDGTTPCAVIAPPATPVRGKSGSMVQTLEASAFRGRTVRFSAWILVQPFYLEDSGQLWMRVNRPSAQSPIMGLLDNLSDKPVISGGWTRSEITLNVNPDAETIAFGVLSSGAGKVLVKDVSVLVIGGTESESTREEPQNLRFSKGAIGAAPPDWRVLPDSETTPITYKSEGNAKGCRFGPPCAVLISPGNVAPGAYGTMLQSFSAAKYRGKTVRLRASLRLQRSGKDDHARLWLRTGRAGENVSVLNLFEHMDYREIRTSDWTQSEIVRKIDDDVEEIGIGVMLKGKGRVFIDQVAFTVIADAETLISRVGARLEVPVIPDAPTAPGPLVLSSMSASMSNGAAHHATLVGALPESTWPSLPKPSIAEQDAAVNAASRMAVNYIRDLPNFVCSLTIDRSENRADSGWSKRDVLTVQLGFSERKEHYKLTEVNGRPTNSSYRTVGGAISEGDFGGVLAEIFRPHAAKFTWDHWTNLRNRVAQVYRYEIKVESSGHELTYGTPKRAPISAVTAHHGYIYIEKGTNNVLRIEQVSDPPAGFPIRYADNNLDYDWSDVGGRQYLLPLRAEITLGSATVRTFNVVQFRDYRKFGADSQITFEQP